MESALSFSNNEVGGGLSQQPVPSLSLNLISTSLSLSSIHRCHSRPLPAALEEMAIKMDRHRSRTFALCRACRVCGREFVHYAV